MRDLYYITSVTEKQGTIHVSKNIEIKKGDLIPG